MEPIPATHEVDPNYLPPAPQDNEKCPKCESAFGLFTRRKHCVHCGMSYCAYHCATIMEIKKFNIRAARVCDHCVKKLETEHNVGWRQEPETLCEYKEGEQFWNCDEDGERPIIMSKSGVGSREPTTVMAVFKNAVKNHGDKRAMSVEREGKWIEWTYKQYYADVECAARAMISLGLKRFQAVNIIGFNSPEWLIANMAAIAAGGKAAGIYTTNGPEACKYISEHSEAAVVVVENEMQLNKFLQVRDELPHLKAIVQYTGKVPEGANVDGKAKCYDWKEFMAMGRGDAEADLQKQVTERIEDQKPGQCCTLIYTSGTTGNPKAVMISHDNITWTARSLLSIMYKFGQNKDGEHIVSYLPLSHIAAQMLDIHAPLAGVGGLGVPAQVYFARPDALKGTLGATLKHANPTVFFGVPRVWEKMEEKIRAIGAANTGLKASIGAWAKGVGLKAHKADEVAGDHKKPFGHGIAGAVIFSKIRAALGLTRCHAMFTGAAPIAHSTLDYFGSLGIPVCELYGMSENTGPQNVSQSDFRITGSCGRPLPGMEIKIEHVPGRDEPGNGEICFRGRHVMMGYMKDPKKTQEAIDPQGFLHSGDVGRVDKNGMLYITGRIKELIITAGGENIAPVPIEDKLKAEMPALSNVMMVGDKRKYNVCLVTLKTDQNPETGAMLDTLTGAAKDVSEVKTVPEAMCDEAWHKYITAGITAVNKTAVSNAQKIQKFVILPKDFGVDTGELTPTLKLKRPIVVKRYHELIEQFYGDANNSSMDVCKSAAPAAKAEPKAPKESKAEETEKKEEEVADKE